MHTDGEDSSVNETPQQNYPKKERQHFTLIENSLYSYQKLCLYLKLTCISRNSLCIKTFTGKHEAEKQNWLSFIHTAQNDKLTRFLKRNRNIQRPHTFGRVVFFLPALNQHKTLYVLKHSAVNRRYRWNLKKNTCTDYFFPKLLHHILWISSDIRLFKVYRNMRRSQRSNITIKLQ